MLDPSAKPDIAQGVQNSMESRKQHVAGEEWKMGAGDQGS